MPNLSTLTLIGHLGRDVYTKFLPSGDQIAEFSIATTLKRKAGDVTTWWRCTAFGKTAEIAAQYLAKGDACMVIGTAYNEPWTDKQGADRLTLKVMVDKIVLLGKRAEAEPSPRAAPEAPKDAKAPPSTSFDDLESDLPF
jgi:single-strand DNA-binding protein